MQIGWCRPLDDAALLQRVGLDFIEVPLAAQGLEDKATFAANKRRLQSSPLPTAAFNYFFPQDMRIVGPDIDSPRVDTYLARLAEMLAAARAKIVVLGSGWARNVPDGFERERAEAQFLATLSQSADRLEGTGCTLVIEPLNRKESNIINSVADGVRFARQINRPQICVLADFYHMDEENEPFETLRDNRDWLAHIHLADTGRRNPGTGGYDYAGFFGVLKEIGYAGRISAECTIADPETDMRHSLAFLRGHWPVTA